MQMYVKLALQQSQLTACCHDKFDKNLKKSKRRTLNTQVKWMLNP